MSTDEHRSTRINDANEHQRVSLASGAGRSGPRERASKGVRGTKSPEEPDAVYSRVTWRLLPFLMLCYVVAYLDRVNVGFARLQMLEDLHFSEIVYGLGAGMFFIGYFFFEVPSNLLLHRVGARVWIARIMITWGMVSASFMFIRTPASFYILRFILGIAEAGFFPGIILYLTYWYPAERRARMVALFMAAPPLAGVFGGPLSGWIMQSFAGKGGLPGWQWLFLLEAIPAIIVGFAVLFYLDNGIRSAKWLDDHEKALLEERIAKDRAAVSAHASLKDVFADRRLWRLCVIYFCCVMGHYGLTFWMPVLIQSAGVAGTLRIGLFTAIPYSGAVVAMFLLGSSADLHRERRWHTAVPMTVGAIFLSLSAIAGTHTTIAIMCLTIAAGGVLSSGALFWSLPTAFLGGVSAAAGIAAINSVGNLAGFVSPYVVGWLKDLTHSTEAGMFAVSSVLIVGAAAILTISPKLVNR
jgi:D-galactonate transporter